MAHRTTSLVKLALFTIATILASCVVGTASAATAADEASTARALVNDARRDAGRSVLRVDPRLERVARAQSEQMAAQGSIFHNTNLGRDVTAAGVRWGWVGENVGVGPDAHLIHEGFMNSPSHRDVLLRPYANAFGVGAVFGKNGRLYITQVFAKVVGSAPVAVAAPMRSAPAAAPAARPAPARPKVVVRSPDPNAVTSGVITHTVFGSDGARWRAGRGLG